MLLDLCLPLFDGESRSAPPCRQDLWGPQTLPHPSRSTPSLFPVMARGSRKNISDETKRHVVNLHYNDHRKQADIARDLRISLSSVEKILGQYRRESQGLHVPTLRVRGRPRILRVADVDVRSPVLFRTRVLTISAVLSWFGPENPRYLLV